MKSKLIWLCYFPINLFANLVAILLSPILAMCVKKVYYKTTVKRLNNQVLGFDRYVLWDCLSWFQTFDNACDEYYWGMYGDSVSVEPIDYDSSILLRYWYRVAWLARNPAYGFAQSVLGAEPPAFQIKKPIPIGFGYYLDINIGWKSHPPLKRLMYAGRLFTFRKLSIC